MRTSSFYYLNISIIIILIISSTVNTISFNQNTITDPEDYQTPVIVDQMVQNSDNIKSSKNA